MAGLKFEVSVAQSDLTTFGVGCNGSSGVPTLSLTGDGKINGSVGISVANCPATTPLFHVFGLTRLAGGIDLAIAGAPGCYLYQPVDIVVGTVSDSSGGFSWRTPIPNDRGLLCARLYTQVFVTDAPANSWGITASNYGRILVGN
jgi:hypothetical protein